MNESNNGTRTVADRARSGINVAVSVIGAAIILLAVNYLAMRHYVRADWTSAGMYTLSDKSIKVLEGLPGEVQLLVLWSQSDDRFPDVKELLDRYAAHSPKLRVEVIDPDVNGARAQIVIDRYGARMQDLGQGMMAMEAAVIAVSGENVKFVPASDFESFAPMLPTGEPDPEAESLSGFRAEQSITSAILSVTAATQPKACLTQGHGEWLFEGFGGRSAGHVKEALIRDGFKVEAITTGGGALPKDCDLIAVIGPERALRQEEADQLGAYLASGGRLLLLLDPVIDGERFAPSGLEGLLAKNGIALGRDLLIETDPRRLVNQSPLSFLASEFTGHDAVSALAIPDSVGEAVKAELGAYPVLFATARSLSAITSAEVIAEPLARTSPSSWGETAIATIAGTSGESPERSDEDTPGPGVIAMASEPSSGPSSAGRQGRLVVVGDSDFLSEELLVQPSLHNQDFFSGLVGWLTDRGELISIAPKDPEHVRLSLTESDVSTIAWVLIGSILFVIVLGVMIWVRRRS